MVFFYGHGYGPRGLFFDADADDASVKSLMPLSTLSDALDLVGERAAVIVFRACQASTLEAAYQLRDAGQFMNDDIVSIKPREPETPPPERAAEARIPRTAKQWITFEARQWPDRRRPLLAP